MAFNFSRPRFAGSKVPYFRSDELPTGGSAPLEGSGTMNITDHVAGEYSLSDVAVPGAVVGDKVAIVITANNVLGVIWDAWVISDGQVRARGWPSVDTPPTGPLTQFKVLVWN